jgi:hypothetical protein
MGAVPNAIQRNVILVSKEHNMSARTAGWRGVIIDEWVKLKMSPSQRDLFTTLGMLVNHHASSVEFNGESCQLQIGQVLTSLKELVKRTRASRSTIQRGIDWLLENGYIRQETTHNRDEGRIITIVDFEKYFYLGKGTQSATMTDDCSKRTIMKADDCSNCTPKSGQNDLGECSDRTPYYDHYRLEEEIDSNVNVSCSKTNLNITSAYAPEEQVGGEKQLSPVPTTDVDNISPNPAIFQQWKVDAEALQNTLTNLKTMNIYNDEGTLMGRKVIEMFKALLTCVRSVVICDQKYDREHEGKSLYMRLTKYPDYEDLKQMFTSQSCFIILKGYVQQMPLAHRKETYGGEIAKFIITRYEQLIALRQTQSAVVTAQVPVAAPAPVAVSAAPVEPAQPIVTPATPAETSDTSTTSLPASVSLTLDTSTTTVEPAQGKRRRTSTDELLDQVLKDLEVIKTKGFSIVGDSHEDDIEWQSEMIRRQMENNRRRASNIAN